MKTPNLNLYAVPLALLVMAGGLAHQSAAADTGDRTTFEARFVYNPSDSAEQIYTDIRRTAQRLCETPGPRPFSLRKLERECTANLVEAAVKRISRPDIASVHARSVTG